MAGLGGGLAIALAAAFSFSLAAGYFGYQRVASATITAPPPTTPVRRGTLAASISAAGNVVATRQAKLPFGAAGRIRTVNVSTGDAVTAGQVLATLDPSPFEFKIRQAESNLRSAELRRQQLLEGATPEEVAAAEASYNAAVAKYNDLLAGPRPSEIQAARAAYNAAVAKLADLENGPTEADVRSAVAAVESGRSAHQSALAKLELLRGGPTEADLRSARQAVVAAESALVKAENDVEKLKQPPSNDELVVAKADLEKKRIALQQAQAAYDRVAWRGDIGIRPEAGTLEQATIDYQAALANYNIKQAGPTTGDLATAESGVRSARAGLESARAKLDQLLAGPTPSDLDAAQAAIDSAWSNYQSAESRLATLTAGATAGDLENSRSAVAAARAKIDSLTQPAQPGDLATAQSQIRTAEATLATRVQPPQELDLAIAEENVVIAQIALDQAKEDLEAATLRAPFAGRVGAITGNPGEQVTASGAMLTLIDPRAVRIDVSIDESDLGKVTVGKTAEIRFDALPDQALTGQVVAISPSATIEQGVVTYLTSIRVEPGEASLPAGMTANVSIIVDQVTDALIVPNRAIRRQGRGQVVDVLVDGQVETRTVRTGLSNDQSTQIVEGLNPNDQVVLPVTRAAQPRGVPGGPGGPVFVQPGGGG